MGNAAEALIDEVDEGHCNKYVRRFHRLIVRPLYRKQHHRADSAGEVGVRGAHHNPHIRRQVQPRLSLANSADGLPDVLLPRVEFNNLNTSEELCEGAETPIDSLRRGLLRDADAVTKVDLWGEKKNDGAAQRARGPPNNPPDPHNTEHNLDERSDGEGRHKEGLDEGISVGGGEVQQFSR